MMFGLVGFGLVWLGLALLSEEQQQHHQQQQQDNEDSFAFG